MSAGQTGRLLYGRREHGLGPDDVRVEWQVLLVGQRPSLVQFSFTAAAWNDVKMQYGSILQAGHHGNGLGISSCPYLAGRFFQQRP